MIVTDNAKELISKATSGPVPASAEEYNRSLEEMCGVIEDVLGTPDVGMAGVTGVAGKRPPPSQPPEWNGSRKRGKRTVSPLRDVSPRKSDVADSVTPIADNLLRSASSTRADVVPEERGMGLDPPARWNGARVRLPGGRSGTVHQELRTVFYSCKHHCLGNGCY